MGSLQGDAENMVRTVVGEKLHFVLVHGLGGGGWCWYKLRCLMENSGYKVTCLDLKSAGIDQTDAKSVISFDDYNQPLMDFMSTLSDSEQVILVGHSAGGLSVTAATHKFPNKISLAIYVAATMLQNGFVTPQDFIDGVPDLSQFGDVYDVEFGLGPNQPPRSAVVKKELERNIVFHSCPQEDTALAAMLTRPGPIAAILSAKFLAADDKVVNKVPRIFIKTTHDTVLKPHQQEAMIKRWPPAQVFALESDHNPNFSAPFLLFGFLIEAAIAVE